VSLPTTTAGGRSAAQAPEAGRTAATPLLVLAGVVAGAVLVLCARFPLRDTDLPWHVLLGREILAGAPVHEAGRGWSIAPVPDTWVTTQWLSEVGLALAQRSWGWTGILELRLLSLAAALATLAVASLRHRTSAASLVPFLVGAVTLLLFAQERSQQITFVLAPLLGLGWLRGVREGRLVPWWVVLVVVALWANVHGGWFLAPLALAGVAAGRWLDHGWHDPVARRALALAGVSLVAACLTPLGPAGLLKPLDFAGSTASINEWQRTVPTDVLGIPALLLVAVLLVAWARGAERPPRSEVAWLLALVAFSLLAFRNLPPAVLLMAAAASWRLARTWPGGRPAAGREGTALTFVALGAAGAGLLAGLVMAATVDPLPDDLYPTSLWSTVAAAPGPARVLAADGQSGWLLLTSPPPHTQVAIDGRADRNGADYIASYVAMRDGRPGWTDLFDRLRPDFVLLPVGTPLLELAQTQRGFHEVGRQADVVLLAR
jgi:hypothetical protein